jgi:hypothetical protein
VWFYSSTVIEVSEIEFVMASILNKLKTYLLLSKALIVKLKQKVSARRLVALGGSEPQLKSIPRRRPYD